MNALLSLTMLFSLMPVSRPQKWPKEFYEIPEQVRTQATLIVTGTYGRGRSPCIFMPDGSRRWAFTYWFAVARVYRGQVRGKTISINSAMLPKSPLVNSSLQEGHSYLVLLRPGAESMKMIKNGHIPAFWEALKGDEILAIVELK